MSTSQVVDTAELDPAVGVVKLPRPAPCLGLGRLSRSRKFLRYWRPPEGMAEVLGRDIKKVPTLQGTSGGDPLFYEASTRTRVSFEEAGKVLSAEVINMAALRPVASDKGESLAQYRADPSSHGCQRYCDTPPPFGSTQPAGSQHLDRVSAHQRLATESTPTQLKLCWTYIPCNKNWET